MLAVEHCVVSEPTKLRYYIDIRGESFLLEVYNGFKVDSHCNLTLTVNFKITVLIKSTAS